MEDDVEVELELEKQLALAHELFPANFRKASYLFRNSKLRILQTNSFMLSYFWPNFDSLIIIKYRYQYYTMHTYATGHSHRVIHLVGLSPFVVFKVGTFS